MNLEGYFKRIGYTGPADATPETLDAVHRHHACNVAYENLDVILQNPVDQDIERIYHKIVDRNRGGWCYEMNGLLAWALTELGFEVTRICGGVMRAMRGDEAFGNHLVLAVQLEQPWIADVGLGDGILQPIPLVEGETVQGERRFRLENLAGDEWRFHNHAGRLPPSFDFFARPADEALIAATCDVLQADPESMFRQNLVCQRMAPDGGGHTLLGRVLTDLGSGRRTLLNSEAELRTTLQTTFGLQLPDLDGLWDNIVDRHETLFGSTPVDDIHFGPPPD